jgi:HEPN domain-containing protein
MLLRHAYLILSLFAASALCAELKVSTRFEPPRIAVGQTAKYIVEIVESDGNSMPTSERITSLPIPQSGGLTLRNGSISSSQQTRITNGLREFSLTQQLNIDALASQTGSYRIPAYTFKYKGEHLQAPAATLTVVEKAADAAPTVNELIFLKADAPAKLYVGQTTPVTLKLYISDNVRLRGLNAFDRNADGFTMSSLPDESIESIENVNGRRYRVLSWPLQITPISAGSQDLNFQFTLTAQMPERRNSRDAISRSPFGNSLFDDFFGRSERFNVYTEPTQIEVRALPNEGRPPSFSGAIGDFNMEVYTDAESTRVDEPIMLSLKLSGHGNFDRIKGPEMPSANGWRNYSPEAFFEADDAVGLKGVKRFDYVFIPEKTGALPLPEVSFAFFDPQAEKYVELTSPPLTVEVAPSQRPSIAAQATTPPATDNTAPALNLATTLSPEQRLLTLDYRPSNGRSIEPNQWFSAWFYALNAAALVALSTAFIWTARRKQLRTDADARLVYQAKLELKAAVQACRSSDADTFYRSAQQAIRLAATKRLKRNHRAANLSELEQQFKQIELPEEVIQNTRMLFQAADSHRFSGASPSADLRSARTQLNAILKAL